MYVLSALLTLVGAVFAFPAKAREARSSMNVSASVSEGCRASATPMASDSQTAGENGASNLAYVRVRCGKQTPYSISLRGTGIAARSTVRRAAQRMKQGFGAIRLGSTVLDSGNIKAAFRAKAGWAARFIASARLDKAAFGAADLHDRPVIIAIDF